MSKSEGNTVDPLEWMDRTAPTRCASRWPAGPTRAPTRRSARTGSPAARNFGTKLWNATRFALVNGRVAGAAAARQAEPTDADRWILGRLREVREQTDALLEDFQFAKAAEGLYHFTWDEVCDWYLELAKAAAAPTTATARRHPGRARARPGRAAAAAAPGHPVRHRGAVDRR